MILVFTGPSLASPWPHRSTKWHNTQQPSGMPSPLQPGTYSPPSMGTPPPPSIGKPPPPSRVLGALTTSTSHPTYNSPHPSMESSEFLLLISTNTSPQFRFGLPYIYLWVIGRPSLTDWLQATFTQDMIDISGLVCFSKEYGSRV